MSTRPRPCSPLRRRLLRCTGLLLALMLSAGALRAQSCGMRISLITCGQGDDLYSSWGHCAVRIVDSSSGRDLVFNYGTFDFSQPDFYWQFTRGKLLYFLSVDTYADFIGEYREENRSVTEQVLNLSCVQKQAIWDYLSTNYLPENRYYKYDFLFDNCSTRVRDIFARTLGDGWKVPNLLQGKHLSYREAFSRDLKGSPWISLGINLLLGKGTDAEMSSWQAMYLPAYLEEGVAHSSLGPKPMVRRTQMLYTSTRPPLTDAPWYEQPLSLFVLIALLVLWLSLRPAGSLSRRLMPWIDRCLFFLSGLLGSFMLFMWLGTDHTMCAWNLNLLWALPTHLVFSFFTQKRSLGVRRYAALVLLINLLLIAGWFELPQQLPLAALPLIALLAFRSLVIFRRPAQLG